jgi:hypothetical protein
VRLEGYVKSIIEILPGIFRVHIGSVDVDIYINYPAKDVADWTAGEWRVIEVLPK